MRRMGGIRLLTDERGGVILIELVDTSYFAKFTVGFVKKESVDFI